MTASQLATIVYGAIALVLAFTLSYISNSYWGMAFATLAAGATYVFQALDVASGEIDPYDQWAPLALILLWVLVVILWLASLFAGFV